MQLTVASPRGGPVVGSTLVRLTGDGFGGRAIRCRFGWYEVEATYVRQRCSALWAGRGPSATPRLLLTAAGGCAHAAVQLAGRVARPQCRPASELRRRRVEHGAAVLILHDGGAGLQRLAKRRAFGRRHGHHRAWRWLCRLRRPRSGHRRWPASAHLAAVLVHADRCERQRQQCLRHHRRTPRARRGRLLRWRVGAG